MSHYGPQEARGGEHRRECPNPDCPHPGGVFYTDHPRQVYCSQRCKKQITNRRYYQANREQVIERVKAARKS
jgi:hypothetical protein